MIDPKIEQLLKKCDNTTISFKKERNFRLFKGKYFIVNIDKLKKFASTLEIT